MSVVPAGICTVTLTELAAHWALAVSTEVENKHIIAATKSRLGDKDVDARTSEVMSGEGAYKAEDDDEAVRLSEMASSVPRCSAKAESDGVDDATRAVHLTGASPESPVMTKTCATTKPGAGTRRKDETPCSEVSGRVPLVSAAHGEAWHF